MMNNQNFMEWIYKKLWTPLNPGFYSYLVAVETVNCFTRQSAMESSVVYSLPNHAFTPTLVSTGWNDQL